MYYRFALLEIVNLPIGRQELIKKHYLKYSSDLLKSTSIDL